MTGNIKLGVAKVGSTQAKLNDLVTVTEASNLSWPAKLDLSIELNLASVSHA